MRLGVVLPTYEIPADPTALADFAQAAEQLGYSYLAVMDHVAGADLARRANWEGRETLVDFHEPFVLFGYLAGLTRRLEFYTSVLVLPQRQTVLVAKQAAQVDVLSGGRLRLGVGVGWAAPEFQALNEDYRTRGAPRGADRGVVRALHPGRGDVPWALASPGGDRHPAADPATSDPDLAGRKRRGERAARRRHGQRRAPPGATRKGSASRGPAGVPAVFARPTAA